MINRSKRAIEFELVDKQDLGTGRLEAKGVRYVPALATTLGPRESVMVEVCECVLNTMGWGRTRPGAPTSEKIETSHS